ncbi:hypothetical protein DFH08DRAFT_333285 [Mycena albidolilacea]|uniref:Uncharacterized protein n=1 Tax=Mycena albidolilacea TaxID=1033008 RepID=A0AAD6ZKV9_9AGAR|nr:hypothetical protein DFH08DRAFT_333285 [Mycena albidolilacea]
MFATSPLILLLAASFASAASLPLARTTTYQFCGFGDRGQDGPITRCFYDNSGALVEGTEFYPPGPVAVAEPPNCLVVTE